VRPRFIPGPVWNGFWLTVLFAGSAARGAWLRLRGQPVTHWWPGRGGARRG
jgi:hypothetical protein